MKASENNRGQLDENAIIKEMLKAIPGYEDYTEEELYNVIESLKELSLILYSIYMDPENQKNGS